MSIQTDTRNTQAFATSVHGDNTNPDLLRNWELPIAFAMSQVGVAHLTTENLPLFMARQNVWYAAMGQRSPFHTDPTIPEMFIGMHVWGRHSEGDLTDAAFARVVTRITKTAVMDLTRIYKNRKPGDFMHNLSLEDKIAAKCSTCPSHHGPDRVHDGERSDD